LVYCVKNVLFLYNFNEVDYMVKAFKQIPKPLQKQILYRLGYGTAILFVTILLLFYTMELFSVLACVLIILFFILNSFLLFRRAVIGDYVVIRGECIGINLTAIKRRIKTIIVYTEDNHTIKIIIKQRLKKIQIGSKIMLYVASNVPVYEKNRIYFLNSYLALDMEDDK